MNGKYRVWYNGRMYYEADNPNPEIVLRQSGEVCCGGNMFSAAPSALQVLKGAIPLFTTGHTVKDKDGNERELYDGDIVEWRPEQSPPMIRMVVWDNKMTAYMLRCKSWSILMCAVNADNTTIIGNKYENPELVEEVQNG